MLCIYLWHQLRRDIISQPASAVAVPSLPRAMMGHHTFMPAHNSTKIYSASDVTQRNMELKSYLYILESNVWFFWKFLKNLKTFKIDLGRTLKTRAKIEIKIRNLLNLPFYVQIIVLRNLLRQSLRKKYKIITTRFFFKSQEAIIKSCIKPKIYFTVDRQSRQLLQPWKFTFQTCLIKK